MIRDLFVFEDRGFRLRAMVVRTHRWIKFFKFDLIWEMDVLYLISTAQERRVITHHINNRRMKIGKIDPRGSIFMAMLWQHQDDAVTSEESSKKCSVALWHSESWSHGPTIWGGADMTDVRSSPHALFFSLTRCIWSLARPDNIGMQSDQLPKSDEEFQTEPSFHKFWKRKVWLLATVNQCLRVPGLT